MFLLRHALLWCVNLSLGYLYVYLCSRREGGDKVLSCWVVQKVVERGYIMFEDMLFFTVVAYVPTIFELKELCDLHINIQGHPKIG